MHRLSRGTLAAALASLVLAACSRSGAPGADPATPPDRPASVRISGHVAGASVDAVTVRLSGPRSGSTVTDATGYYEFSALPAGTYVLTPEKAGRIFAPASVTVAVAAGATGDLAAATATASACSADGWCWENPLPQGNTLRGVWAAPDGGAWAVGESGTILRRDEGRWFRVDSGTTATLHAVWAPSRDEAWAVGSRSGAQHAEAVALRWDGTAWAPTGLVDYQLFEVWGLSSRDVWAVGTAPWHWDGSTWTSTEVVWWRGAARGVWGAASNDVWLVGDYGLVAHWDGESWTTVASGVEPRRNPLDLFFETPNLHAVWGSGAADVWAAGSHGTVIHWDGTAWSNVTPGTCGAVPACCSASCQTWDGVWYDALSGTGPDDLWAVGRTGLIHWDGSGWSSVDRGTGNLVLGLHAATPTDGWSVGNRGDLVRWDGTAWTPAWTGPTRAILNGVWGSGPDDVWAVGTWGTTLRWLGAGWEEVPGPRSGISSFQWTDVWGTASDDAWALGLDGTVAHWDGGGWSTVATPLRGEGHVFGGLHGTGPQDVWAVGDELLHFDGQAWTSLSIPSGLGLRDVWTASATDAWAVGASSNGAITAHWNGSAWAFAQDPYGPYLNAVSGTSASDVWAVGDSGTIRRYDGQTWTAIPSLISASLWSVVALARDDVWIGGHSGTLLHWDGVALTPVDAGTTEYGFGDLWAASPTDLRAVGEFGIVLRLRP